MKTIQLFLSAFTISALFLASCGSTDSTTKDDQEKKDTVATDETETPVIDEVEMEYVYEVTDTKTKKTVQMSQEEYLESGVWENPDMIIKEVPLAR